MKWFTTLAALVLAAHLALAEDPATFSVSAFSFTRPADWTWVPVTSTMRKAQLKVPGANAEAPAADIVFFYFGSQSGDVQSNVSRWVRQFDAAPGSEKVEEQTAGNTKVTIVSTEGTFNSGMPGQPTTPLANYALLGAILEHKEGAVYVKMTGPAELVKAKRAQFIDFVAAGAKTVH